MVLFKVKFHDFLFFAVCFEWFYLTCDADDATLVLSGFTSLEISMCLFLCYNTCVFHPLIGYLDLSSP